MNQKRQILSDMYSKAWVDRKNDAQILAIFLRLQREGKIKV